MAADALVPYIARSSGTTGLTVQDKEVLVFHKGFQQPVPFQVFRKCKKYTYILQFQYKIHDRDK